MSEVGKKVSTLRKWLVAGVLVWAPLAITFWVINAVVGFMDQTILLLPRAYRPETLLGFNIPGLGAVMAVIIVLVTGALVANFLGRKLISMGESVLSRIPLVRSVYSAVKQVIETFVSQDSRSFRNVVLVEYPRKDCWSLAFLAGDPVVEVQEKTAQKLITVFVPTAPNPTSGFVIMVPEYELIELDMSVEEGFRMVISLGVVTPKSVPIKTASPEPALENPTISG
ncbi:MAG TPA: DUF502 domain-containing protein [Halothiobacillus sp.]|nr:MAG: hypothetical protein B7Z82_02055 [Halothiobacillus sp. 20-54-6]HQT42887.1 DUF502 domain-containing protein [Halothiobacillus sp.]